MKTLNSMLATAAIAPSILISGMGSALAQEISPPRVSPGGGSVTLSPVVVSGTRMEQSSFSLPMSVDVVEGLVMQEASRVSICPKHYRAYPEWSFKTGKIMHKICRYRAVALAHAPLSAYAGYASSSTTFPPACRTGRARRPISTSVRRNASKYCAALFPLSMAMPQAG